MEPMTPNLFILGAAKCGSSSLHAILAQHPDIHASPFKEPQFFSWPFQLVESPMAYFKLFSSKKRYRMESSTAYLCNPDTPALLRCLFPDARLIVSVRHPASRAYSQYRNNVTGGIEPLPTFLEALRAEAERYSISFTQHCVWDYGVYLYCRSSNYDEQLARYFALFDAKRIHILTLAELSKNPVATTETILQFLDLDEAPARHFDYRVRNQHSIELPPCDNESRQIMDVAFRGVIERTEHFAGRALDWSM